MILLLLAGLLHAEETSLDIDRAVQLGLESGEIRAESQKIEEARGQLRQSIVRPNPTAVFDRQDIADEGIAPGFVQDLVKIEQSFLGDRRRGARRKLGEREIERAEWEVATARRRKTAVIRQAFIRALEAQEVVQARTAILARVRELQRIIETRVAAGESSRYEQARVRLALSQEEDEISAARQEWARAGTELASAMATPLSGTLELQGSLLPGSLSPEALVVIREDASAPGSRSDSQDVTSITELGRSGSEKGAGKIRPEIGLETARVRSARAQESVARSDRHPQLTAGLGYMAFEQTALPMQNGYNAVLAVSLPIWDRKEGEIQAARARTEAARQNLDALGARIDAEAQGFRDQTRIALTRLGKLEETQRSQVAPLVELAETSYQAGMQTLLELLDAYRLERDFQVQRIRARSALRQALENLAFASFADPVTFLDRSFVTPSERRGEKTSHSENHK